MNPSLRIPIGQFIDKHDPSEDQQHKALIEEVGELAEALNRDADDDAVAEELADIVFIAYTLAYMRDVDLEYETVQTARENVDKDTSTDGAKITKQKDGAEPPRDESVQSASGATTPPSDDDEITERAVTRSVEVYGKEMEEAMKQQSSAANTEASGDELAHRLLEDVGHLVDSDRDTHGDAVQNQEHIASGWSWYLRGQGHLDDDDELTGLDVAYMMAMLKMSRNAVGEFDIDHPRDVAGYAGIGAACSVKRGWADEDDLEVADYGDHE